MAPFADFLFFRVMLLYIILPTIVFGLFGKANRRWAALANLVSLVIIFWGEINIRPTVAVQFLELVAGYAVYQTGLAWAFFRWRSRPFFYVAIPLAILPLACSKFLPLIPDTAFGFYGISYITFRALDVLFSMQDRVLTVFAPAQYLAFLFFFPTVLSGPIDRYRRFGHDWNRLRGRHEFLDDLDAAVQRIFQGFLYKFIIAAMLERYWVSSAEKHAGLWYVASYMYAYTFYLFFDFAGYTAFAIGFSRLFGIKSPENFDKPFLSRNIKDFWNRWHISLSFWFRDHVYMRFLLAAGKGKWFTGKHTASYLGLFLTFGLMGVWHGPERYYLIYGAYHAVLLCGYDAFARWNKQRKFWPEGRLMRAVNIVLTFHAVAFGLLIFSGHLFQKPLPRHDEVVDEADCHAITGWVWDAQNPDRASHVDIYIDDTPIGRLTASELRPDLQARGYGNGQHGFTYILPDAWKDGHPHTVEAKAVESGLTLRNTPATFTCSHP